MNDYYLAKYKADEFTQDYQLVKKLMQMEEYRSHPHFRLFVDILLSKHFKDCDRTYCVSGHLNLWYKDDK